VENIQDALHEALFTSGALLVTGRAGLGKTREVAELVARLCKEGWTVCVARGGSDTRMDALASFPDELRNGRVLFVLDDLHQRTTADTGDQRPYADRLNAFLSLFDRSLRPGDVYVLATARSEPHHWRQLGYNSGHPLWRRFTLYGMPELTKKASQEVLLAAAEQAGVKMSKQTAARLVADSDKTPRTYVLNVERARERGISLTKKRWMQVQGRTWKACFHEARARWPEVVEIFSALHLTRETTLPTRFVYVVALASELAGADASAAANGLVDFGLMGLRDGILDAFAAEQFEDDLRTDRSELPSVADHWDVIRTVIIRILEEHPDLESDLVTLTTALAQQERWLETEAMATTAIERGSDHADIYLLRGIARFELDDFAGAEADLTTAIERGRDDVATYFRRGCARLLQGKVEPAAEDLSAASEEGPNDAPADAVRGGMLFQLARYTEATATAAIEQGEQDAEFYFWRGRARLDLGRPAEAEMDLTATIERGWDEAATYAARGQARLDLRKYADAEADFTAAIDRGLDEPGVYQRRAICRVFLGQLNVAWPDCKRAEAGATEDPWTHVAWGWWYLVRQQYEDAVLRFGAAREVNSDREWYLEEALALLLSGQLAAAEAAYSLGLEEASPADIAEALWNLDFWTNRQADRVASEEAQATIAAIRRQLESTEQTADRSLRSETSEVR
jgi:tetratricopeptide (TPR) repeat protein